MYSLLSSASLGSVFHLVLSSVQHIQDRKEKFDIDRVGYERVVCSKGVVELDIHI